MVAALLRAEGYDVHEASSGADGIMNIADDEPDVALLDLMMPGELDGMATLARIRERWTDLPIVMMSGRASLGDAVRATKLGAVNFLEKPLAPETVLLALSSALELRRSRRTTRELREALGLTGEMVGSSEAMKRVREIIARVAPSDARVLISGESGTGKELVAAAIHNRGPRRDRPFVRVNCAAIPKDLVESEMFGHEKGAFTGATASRVGRFETAHTGTLFLDEVGDLNIEAQAKLLRAIEAKEIQRVGGNRTIRVDVRVIAATNKDLEKAVAEGTFREDLYFRLNVIPIALPPLRERGNDVIELVHHFSTFQHERTGRPRLQWSDEALALVRAYPWPGNIRELANIVERIAILNDGSLVRATDIRAVLPQQSSVTTPSSHNEDVSLADALDATERVLITDALARADGNVAEAARQLRTDRPNLYRRMKRLGITGAVILLAALATLPAHAPAQVPDTVPDTVPTASPAPAPDSLSSSIPDIESPSGSHALHLSASLSTGKTYNRVEGLPILLGPTAQLELPGVAVDAAAYGIIRTGRDWSLKEPDAGHDAHVDVRFGADRRFGIGVRFYQVVAPVEPWQMTQPEEGLAAFLLRRDYFDYYGQHGGKVTASWYATEKFTVATSFARERWSSYDARDVFSVFRGNSRWRDNPTMDSGLMTLYTLDATLDTRNDERDPEGGWYIKSSYEYGHSGALARAPRELVIIPSATDAIDYGRVFVDLRRYNRLSPRTQVNARMLFGGWVQGDELPSERKLSFGGPGTVPGYDFRSPVGPADVQLCSTFSGTSHNAPAECDRVVLGQLELRTQLASKPFGVANAPVFRIRSAGFTANPVGVLFFDVGRGWRTTSHWPSQYKADMGAGIDLGLLGVYVAKALTDWSEPANIFVRVRRRF